jgi:hypothetical protein
MKQKFQFGLRWCVLALGAGVLALVASAQNRQTSDRPPARQQQAPPRPASRPPAGSYHPQNIPRTQNAPRGGNANRQPAYPDRSRVNDNRARGNQNPRPSDNGGANRNDRPQSAYRPQTPAAPPPDVQQRLRNMSPQERNRLAENQKKFNSLPPQKQQEMRQAGENWRKLTPEQQSHIKNDLLPRWQHMPPERQRAIQQRLGVLRNMPESARNRHLDDPNFTRGMSDEDRQMLRDLSHEHVGAPDRPQEQ